MNKGTFVYGLTNLDVSLIEEFADILVNRTSEKINLQKKRGLRVIFPLSACFFAAAIVFVMFVTPGFLVFTTDLPELQPEISDSFFDFPSSWQESGKEPYAILKINSCSSETKDIKVEVEGDAVSCVCCNCEIIYFNTKITEYWKRLECFCGEIYIPVSYKDTFSPGSTVLIDIRIVTGNELYFMPYLDDENCPQFLPFIDGKIELDTELRNRSFYLLDEVNNAIDIASKAEKIPEWLEGLPTQKLEDGMTINEVKRYLNALLPAAEKYYDYVSMHNID